MKRQVRNILVIKHGALGDLMQSIGMLMDIRKHYMSSTITLLTTPPYVQLMQRFPYVDHVIADNRAPIWRIDQQIKLKKKLQRQEIDLVIDLQNSDRSRMYQQFWFLKTEWIGRTIDEKEPVSGLSGLIALLKQAGIAVSDVYQPDMSWMVGAVRKLLKKQGIKKPFIALIPGSSSQHLEKRWPHYPALANTLMSLGYEVVSILGPDETNLRGQLPGHIVQNLGWFELAGVLNAATFVIGNDTGPSHIASYLNKQGLAIFGPTTSATRAEIGRRNFQTIEVPDLDALTIEQVLTYVPAPPRLGFCSEC